jgi:hypothetical protein
MIRKLLLRLTGVSSEIAADEQFACEHGVAEGMEAIIRVYVDVLDRVRLVVVLE